MIDILYRLKRILKKNKHSPVDYYRSRGARIGENVDIINSTIDDNHAYLIEIGNNVTITNATLLAHDASTKRELGFSRVGKIKIGNNVFIGYGVIILPNVTIGNKVIIGAGTIITRDIEENSVVVGNPGKIICSYDAFIEKNRRLMDSKPVFKEKQSRKTTEEKNRMKCELEGTIGFDT